MRSINTLIEDIKKGDEQAFIQLHENFKPLIIAWLRQSKELYQTNREDYESMAKIILYECAKKYDQGRGVPFQSFYKIRLYHWYANYKRKKQYYTAEFQEDHKAYQDKEFSQLIEEEEKKRIMQFAIMQLSEKERHIILRHLEGFTAEQIAQEIGLNKKTILNKKYEAIKKMKDFITSKMHNQLE